MQQKVGPKKYPTRGTLDNQDSGPHPIQNVLQYEIHANDHTLISILNFD